MTITEATFFISLFAAIVLYANIVSLLVYAKFDWTIQLEQTTSTYNQSKKKTCGHFANLEENSLMHRELFGK